MISSRVLRFPHMTTLAAGLAMVLLGRDASAATRVVANCNDSGTGSLRDAVTAAAKNDIIQLPNTCNLITLSRAIELKVGNLTLNGPGASALEISGDLRDRVFTQTTFGTLFINGLSITNGLVTAPSGDASGGCISAMSRVQLTDSVVSGCTASANIGAGNAFGGGIYATGEVVLIRSTVSGNNVFSSSANKHSYGGGVFAGAGFSAESSTIRENTTSSYFNSEGGGVYIFDGAVAINNSTISGNQAGNDGGGLFINSTSGVNISNSTISGNQAGDDGGGLYINTASDVNISNSTISGNQAVHNGGGLYIDLDVQTATISNSTISGNQSGTKGGGFFRYGGTLATINNSTISGNRADRAGGVFSNGDLIVSNSTIAFNTSNQAQNLNQLTAAGMEIFNATLTLNSTIIANNRAAGEASDLSNRVNGAMRGSAFDGSKNLIYARDKLGLQTPMDTASVCPRLQRLAPHGGPTQTVALRSGSFAIDFGIVLNALTTDQRGFPRVVNNRPDIGAYERQVNEQDDALFFSGFESGCDE